MLQSNEIEYTFQILTVCSPSYWKKMLYSYVYIAEEHVITKGGEKNCDRGCTKHSVKALCKVAAQSIKSLCIRICVKIIKFSVFFACFWRKLIDII